LKIPVVALISFIYWAMKEPEAEGPSDRQLRAMPPPLPEPDGATSRHRPEIAMRRGHTHMPRRLAESSELTDP
jgi:hypothetical protein